MRILLVAAAALLATAPAAAAQECAAARQLEGELICPACRTTLDQSNAPVAQRMKRFICERSAAGATNARIKDELAAQFGSQVLAAPPQKGFDLLAWLLPLAGLAAGAAAVAVLAWRWTRAPAGAPGEAAGGHGSLDPALERRLDEELARLD